MADQQIRMTLWGLEIFLSTVDRGSISAAAKQLDVSPSAISQQITNLEAAVGAQLIDRATRPVALTSAGLIFHRRAQAIISEAHLAKTELINHDLSKLTRLRLGMVEDFDSDVTPRLLSDMSDDLKTCHFDLETGASYHLAAMLESRGLDVIVVADLNLPAEWMEVHPLLCDPFMVVAPPEISEDGNDVLAKLLDLPFIRYSTRQMMGQQIETHLAKLGVNIPHRFELDSYHAIMAMVAGGAGWTITTPLGYTRAHRFRDDVSVFPLPFAPLERRVSLFARKGALDTMPGEIANRLRPLLQTMIVEPCVDRLSWLDDELKVLSS